MNDFGKLIEIIMLFVFKISMIDIKVCKIIIISMSIKNWDCFTVDCILMSTSIKTLSIKSYGIDSMRKVINSMKFFT